MPAKENPKDEAARKAYAESLRRQIEDLKAGRLKKPATPSLRDFVDEKMAEDEEKLKEGNS